MSLAVASACGAKTVKTTFYPQIRRSAPSEMLDLASASSDMSEATQLLAQFVNSRAADCGTTILFANYHSIVAHLYSGARISKSSVYNLLNSFPETGTFSLQVCESSRPELTIGISVASFRKLEEIQNVVRSWASGLRVNDTTPMGVNIVDVFVSQDATGNMTSFGPTSQSDGTCSTHKVVAGDVCWDLVSQYHIQPKDIETFNRHTWGWLGCGNLQIGQLICISSGDPPMPAPVPGVTCGPQVPGTERPPSGSGLAGLNPCPLNACCDIWGYCGITAEFCTESPSGTGAPGTAKPGTNGCISNCGVDIVNNGKATEKFRTMGYFEAFDQKRTCLRMSCTEIPAGKYSHVHFAFAAISPSFDIDISDVEGQFNKFSKMTGFKKILSFGGWAFSTDPSTFQLFRDATKLGNRERFVENLINFMGSNNLDGFDFGWEYPAAPDIPNIPTGSSDEGGNYRDFLKLLRDKLPSGKSVSIAIPASYWYLKQYPIKEVALYVDYFIYMTYDLYGQWDNTLTIIVHADVGSKGAISGCEAGNCLRSHINKTETHDAMSMITKAGLETSQIVIGVTSYGRSFRMSQSSCSGPLCTFEGSRSQSIAYAAPCTNTRGYMANAEIKDVIGSHAQFSVFQDFIDKDSDSNILIYGSPGAVDWVAYMDGDLKSNRTRWIESFNFGGSGDWAIDLESHTDGDNGGDQSSGGSGDDNNDAGDVIDLDFISDQDLRCPAGDNLGSLEDLVDKADSLDEECVQLYAVRILYSNLFDSLSLFKTNSMDYDDKFVWYEKWTKEHIQSCLDDFMALGKGKGLKYFDCYRSHPGQKEKRGSYLTTSTQPLVAKILS